MTNRINVRIRNRPRGEAGQPIWQQTKEPVREIGWVIRRHIEVLVHDEVTLQLSWWGVKR